MVLTTNFDPLIEVSIRAAGGTPLSISLDQDARFDHAMPGIVKVVHLCGFWLHNDTLHVQTQLQKPRPMLADALRQLLQNHALVTLAYGGWADAVALAIAESFKLAGTPFDVLWTFFGRQKTSRA
ncbi:SIR2 family protein [Nannocystis pusilla]|uniref:SIR2 family protein n=1 Tax=Nannocystis pusilla TaxID=889268 RepID=UPI003B762453